MPKRSHLIRVIAAVTGMNPLVVERTADKLAEAGHVPPDADFALRDAVVLIVALAGARSPIDAVAAVEAYRCAPLATATTATGAGEIELVIDSDKQPVLDIGEWATVRLGVIDTLALFIAKIPALHRAGHEHRVTL